MTSEKEFDPYHKWLGIKKSDQPPHHYRLLSLDLFEDDPEVIEAAADRQMAYVQQCASGEHLQLSQKLLNELSQVRVNLLNPQKKAAYDAKLREKLGRASGGSRDTKAVEKTKSGAPSTKSASPSRAAQPLKRKSTKAFDRLRRRKRGKTPPAMTLIGIGGTIFVLVMLLVIFTRDDENSDEEQRLAKTANKSSRATAKTVKPDGPPETWKVVATGYPPTSEETGHIWRYSVMKPDGVWFTGGFNDSKWKEATGPFGVRSQRARTEWASSSIWLRTKFELESVDFDELFLRYRTSGTSLVYLNGLQVAKLGGRRSYSETDVSKFREYFRKGINTLAVSVEMRDPSGHFVDLGLQTERTPAERPSGSDEKERPVARTTALAGKGGMPGVEITTNGFIGVETLRVGARIDSGSSGFKKFALVPTELSGRGYTVLQHHKGRLGFKMLSDAPVLLAVCSSGWGGGGGGGSWQKEVIPRGELETKGWKVVGQCAMDTGAKFTIYSRDCKADEEFLIRTMKYVAPFLIHPNPPPAGE